MDKGNTMPQQLSGVTLAASSDQQTVTVQMGPYGYEVQMSQLFDRGFSIDVLKQNLRLAFLIGNYAEPDSLEFRSFVNSTMNGLENCDQKYYLGSITPTTDGQSYTVQFGVFQGQAPNGIEVTRDELHTDWQDRSVIVNNVNVWLRKAGCNQWSDVTPVISAQLATEKFWY